MAQTKLIRSAAGASGLTPNDAVSRVFLAPDNDKNKFTSGRLDFVNGSNNVTPDATNRPAYIGDVIFSGGLVNAIPLKVHKSGAAANNEYLIREYTPGSGLLRLDRNYEEATSPAGGDAYVIASPMVINKFLVVNKDASVAVDVFPVETDGTIGTNKITVDAGATYDSRDTNVLGIQYLGAVGFVANKLEVYFYAYV